MPSVRELFMELGIKPLDLFAGFCGGVVHAFVFSRATPFEVVASVSVGMLTANYLGEGAATLLHLSNGPAAFLTGLCSMAICQGAVESAKKWRPIPPSLPPNSGDAV